MKHNGPTFFGESETQRRACNVYDSSSVEAHVGHGAVEMVKASKY